jgi:hypothetical protein
VGVRQPRKTIAVFCEGLRTEPEYFDALRRLPEVRDVAAVDIQIEMTAGGSAPLTLVRKAVAAKKRNTREEGEIDEFWCVFDVEWPSNHPNLGDAVHLAVSNGVALAISNPSFELWLMLHFRDHSAWLTSEDARRRRRECDGEQGKGLDPARYMPRRHLAAKRAIALEERHAASGTSFPNDNPSSGMHRVISTVEG